MFVRITTGGAVRLHHGSTRTGLGLHPKKSNVDTIIRDIKKVTISASKPKVSQAVKKYIKF